MGAPAGYHEVSFMPYGTRVSVPRGTTLADAAAAAGIALDSSCGGAGRCGRCRVIVLGGGVEPGDAGPLTEGDRQAGYVLACQARVTGDARVEVPAWSTVEGIRALGAGATAGGGGPRFGELRPLLRRVPLRLEPPTLEHNQSDLTRLGQALQKATGSRNVQVGLGVLKDLPGVLRAADWSVSVEVAEARGASEVVAVRPWGGDAGPGPGSLLGVACDIGTTTVVCELVDLATGSVLASSGAYNRQSRFGADVISRMIHAQEAPGGRGRDELQAAVVATINDLVGEAAAAVGRQPGEVRAMVCAGNTTMTHLFLGLDPTYIRLEPYVPAATFPPPVRARDLGLLIDPEAWVYCIPGVASYVGGDIAAGVVAAGVGQTDEVELFVDIGTNGEMVLGNRDWLLACSCSAGPAFEGVGVRHGMRAVRGAIESVRIDPATLEPSLVTVEGSKPVGICGSGLIDCLAEMRSSGVIERNGYFNRDMAGGARGGRIRQGEEGPEYVVVWGSETGHGEDICVTEADVRNLIRSKAAVFAGIRTMLASVDMKPDDIARVKVAGGFGRYLNISKAVQIGLMPDLDRQRFSYVGNTSLAGARASLLFREARREAEAVARRMTYLELSTGSRFMEEFVSALFLPHTDSSLFPTVAQGERGGEGGR